MVTPTPTPTPFPPRPFSVAKRSTWEVVTRVAFYLRPYRLQAVGTIACAVLSLASTFAFPWLIQHVIDDVIRDKHPELLTRAVLGLIGAFLARDLFNSLRIRINNTFEQNVIFDMRCDIFAKLQRLPVGFFDARAAGSLMGRVGDDVNAVERVLIDGTEQGTVVVLSIIGVMIVLFLSNPALAAVAMVPLPFLAAGALYYTITAHERYRLQREAGSAMNALLGDNLQGIRQVKAFSREVHEDGRFAARAGDLREGSLAIMRVWAWYSPSMAFIGSLGLAAVLWMGGHQVLDGQMTFGSLISFLLFLGLFYEPVGRLHGLNQMLQAARAAGERVFDILDAAPESGSRVAQKNQWPNRVRGEVCYENIGFAYEGNQRTLRNISFHASPGQVVALVGATGAGKSSLVNLLPAFYEPTSGSIRIDGESISHVPLETLRQQISVVSQEPFLFNGTIRENILYGKLNATEAEIIFAATAANCHEFITRLPEGYDSQVGERGVKLSVGEKQRVSIARALLKDAPILILDEATASVDYQTELLIQEALERLMHHRTTFVIAHRLSTIRNADQILVMRHGEIVERGTHDQLLVADGVYARLSRIQNTTFIEEQFTKLDEA